MYGHGFASSNWFCGLGSFLPGPFGMLFTLIFWVLVIFFLFKGVSYLFAKMTKAPASSGRVSSSAVEILKERYARDEIGRADFERMKKELT